MSFYMLWPKLAKTQNKSEDRFGILRHWRICTYLNNERHVSPLIAISIWIFHLWKIAKFTLNHRKKSTQLISSDPCDSESLPISSKNVIYHRICLIYSHRTLINLTSYHLAPQFFSMRNDIYLFLQLNKQIYMIVFVTSSTISMF